MNKPIFNKVCIVGVGLIGGSIGLAMREERLAARIIGLVRRLRTAQEAVRRGAVDAVTRRMSEALRGADLIILATPVSIILRDLPRIFCYAEPHAVIIDVGSSKGEICRAAKRYFHTGQKGRRPGPVFVGCHPMAGSEKMGIQFARPDLFKDSICFMTSPHLKVQALWRKLGAKTILITPEKHDLWAARLSHLPHLLSFALFHGKSVPPFPLNPSARAFHRLSKSDPKIWSDIYLSNRDAVLSALNVFLKETKTLQGFLQRKDARRIESFIREANRRAAQFVLG